MLTPVWNCPLCNSQNHQYFRTIIDKIWTPNGMTLVRIHYAICLDCGLVFQWDTMPKETSEKYYGNGIYRATVQNGDFGMSERVIEEQTKRADALIEFVGNLGKPRRILDIGSSTGILLKRLKEIYACEILGVEMNASYREQSGVPAVRDISEIAADKENKFNLITCIHTLEHIAQPSHFLHLIREHLIHPYGKLLIEVPDLHRELSCRLPHPVVFTDETLTRTLQSSGWQIKWLKRYNGWKDTQYPGNLIALCSRGDIIKEFPKPNIKQIFDDHNKYQPIIQKELMERINERKEE